MKVRATIGVLCVACLAIAGCAKKPAVQSANNTTYGKHKPR